MLRTALSLHRSRQAKLSQRYPNILALISSILPILLSNPAIAANEKLGVVRSQENASQWEAITNRLKATGINYCILDAANWQSEADLNTVRVLLLPNVETLNGSQANALDEWMKRGGKLIVTGPTGSLAQPEVRSQLRGLFGAYWGFSTSSPATLKLVDGGLLSPSPQGLTSTLIGGVIIPAGINSQTAAVWLSEGKPPAVVMTDQSMFLGWRWGVDNVASASVDTAWLQTALDRYGVTRSGQLAILKKDKPDACNADPLAPASPSTPILPNSLEQSQKPPQQAPLALSPLPVAPAPSATPQPQPQAYRPSVSGSGLAGDRVTAMSQELESLIARFESTLIAAESSSISLDSPTVKPTEPSTNSGDKNAPTGTAVNTSASSVSSLVNSRSYKAMAEAKASLQKFRELIDGRNYDGARQQWLQARRILWDNYPGNQQSVQPEIRAMWLDRGTIVKAKSEADLAKVFDRMAEAGINSVFFETINAAYPIYPSRVAPEQNPLTRGWDPLKAAVKLAHERGMELHAWTWIFAAANQRHNEILNLPRNYLGPVLSRHPDWVITDKKGNPFDYGDPYKKAFFDPANPEVQRYISALLEEIATNYDVDGIQLDYIRYPFQDPKANQTFGYSNTSRWQFKQMTGVDPVDIGSSHPLWSQWTAFRMQQVDRFVATISERLKQKRPDLMLSAAVFPMPQRERLFRLQQNWEEWGQKGWVDTIVLMTYALDTGNLETMTQPLFEQSVAGSALVIPGVRLLKVPDPVTIDQVQLIRHMPTAGYALFAAENLTPNLQKTFNRTQGGSSPTQLNLVPYRYPFQASAARYQALQRQWRFLLANRQLTMDEMTLKNWGQQVDATASALMQLANAPSEQHLATAQTALSSLRRDFVNPMRQYQSVNPYQVKVWENQLETLDRLLVYGERVILKEKRSRIAGK